MEGVLSVVVVPLSDIASADAAEAHVEQQRGYSQSQQQSDPDPVRAESEGKSEEVGARQADDVVGDAGKYSWNVDVLEPQQGRTAGQLHGVEDLVEGQDDDQSSGYRDDGRILSIYKRYYPVQADEQQTEEDHDGHGHVDCGYACVVGVLPAARSELVRDADGGGGSDTGGYHEGQGTEVLGYLMGRQLVFAHPADHDGGEAECRDL